MFTYRAPCNFASLVPTSVQPITYTLTILRFLSEAAKYASIGLTVVLWKHCLVPWLLTDLCSWFHFSHIHLYRCICKIPRYCYTQHLHHSRVFLQCIRWYLNQQKTVLFSGHSFCHMTGAIEKIESMVFWLHVQLVPFPWIPSLNVQLWDLRVLLHLVFTLQFCVPIIHSSRSSTRKGK